MKKRNTSTIVIPIIAALLIAWAASLGGGNGATNNGTAAAPAAGQQADYDGPQRCWGGTENGWQDKGVANTAGQRCVCPFEYSPAKCMWVDPDSWAYDGSTISSPYEDPTQ